MAYDRASDNRVRLLPGSVSTLLGEWMARAVGWALLIGAITVWLALVSWRASDPSLTHPNGVGAHNFLGPSGAMISDLLLQTVGLTAVFLLAGPIVFGLQLVSRGSAPGAQHRLLFFCASLFLIAAGLSAIPTFAAWPLSHGYGGLLGDILFMLFASLLQPFVGSLAAGLVGLATISLGSLIFATALGLDRQALGQAFAGQRPRARWPNPADGWPPTHHANPMGHPPDHAPSPYPAHGAPPAAYPLPSYPQGGVPASVQHPYPQHDVDGPRAAFPHAAPVAQPVSAATFSTAATSSAAHVQSPQQDAPAATHAEDATHAADHGHHEHEFITLPRIFSKANASRPVGADAAQSAHPSDAPNAIARAMSGLTKWFAGEHAPAEPHPEPRTAIEPTLPPPPKPVGTPRPEPRRPAAYRPPGLNLLAAPKANKAAPELSQTVLRGNAGLLEDVLSDFGVKGEVKAVRPGPVITLYELEIARGIKASRVIGLADDIARSMSAPSARIAVIPGKNTLGIELPNMRRETVAFREILQHDAYGAGQQALPLALGKAIDGTPIVTDLARMPHLLVAGTTGSGKSVGVNAMILSLLYRYGPDRLRLLMIDPKMLELSIYNGIPHLLTPVVTDPAKAVSALNWVVREMEERYKRMAELNVRNIGAFNARLEDALKRGRPMSQRVQTGFDEETGEPVYEERTCATEPLPHIVVIVDEFADLMLVAGKEIEAAIQRLAQMARAAGIHLIMATQRPSVDIVTGTIKANFPTRISFKVASKVDSRTIINEQGAEQLLGQGDMLMSDGSGSLVRVHGAFVSDEEVETVASHLRAQQRPDYVEGITDGADDAQAGSEAAGPRADDGEDLYAKAVAIVLRDRKASTSYVQRRLSIGYNRAADLIERMEADGLISPANHAGKREILAANQ